MKNFSGLRTAATGAALSLVTIPVASTAAHAEALQMPKPVCDGADTILGVIAGFGFVAAVAGIILIGINLVIAHRREDGGFVLGAIAKWGIGAILIGIAAPLASLFVKSTLNCG